MKGKPSRMKQVYKIIGESILETESALGSSLGFLEIGWEHNMSQY